ncbi:hypothetical protein NHX12_024374 [Muraenolepis orangiensis]|uniref:Uncharacterized protein n=1 Tax=Muraenolepis orangiensis TaxID=630683 RepID=A0A9Q0EN41_9TELE|nr:hypothetical protein NHX12_024374 [Muraenolepis orangiensis]
MSIVVGVVSSRKSGGKASSRVDETPYYSHSVAKVPLINPRGAVPADGNSNGFPSIPRATIDRAPLPPTNLEMAPGNGRLGGVPRASSAATRPYNEPAQNRTTTNPYAQNRDPYEQNQATTNLYAQNQANNNQKRGYTNSHYMHDDERY